MSKRSRERKITTEEHEVKGGAYHEPDELDETTSATQ